MAYHNFAVQIYKYKPKHFECYNMANYKSIFCTTLFDQTFFQIAYAISGIKDPELFEGLKNFEQFQYNYLYFKINFVISGYRLIIGKLFIAHN